MRLTDDEKRMLAGEHCQGGTAVSAVAVARAMDYLVQFGDAFGAERFVDVIYAHYPAEMSIYRGTVEDAVEYADTGARVCIPTTTSTLACDLDQWEQYGCPRPLYELQAQVVPAHRKMGILGTYTCTPQWLGFVPPKGSHIITVESSAIVYYNSVLGARTNRGGLFTRYSAVTGKYPLFGYLLDENRRGTHLFHLKLDPDDLRYDSDYSALGFHAGGIVGSEVPVFDALPPGTTQDNLLALGAALATSGSVTLFHAPGHTAEADSVEAAFTGNKPKETYTVGPAELKAAYDKLTTIAPGGEIDFVTLGCPHYTLEQLRYVADWLRANNARVHENVRFWVCTNRMTRQAATWEGITQTIESAGGRVICDTCPVECHMRLSTCKEFGLPTPQVKAMVTDSCKMARYVGDLIGCQTALRPRDECLKTALGGRLVECRNRCGMGATGGLSTSVFGHTARDACHCWLVHQYLACCRRNMKIEPGHRKRVKHWHEPGHAHELTFSCYQRQPLLDDDGRKRLLSQAIDRAVERYLFDLVAFIYMPEHLHLIVLPRGDEALINKLLWAIKRPCSFRIKQQLQRQRSPWLQRLTIRERPGRTVFRLWQEGPGYDRNLIKREAMIEAIEYIHLNPVRRGLCEFPEQWKWSSWHHYHEPDRPPDPDLPRVHGIEFRSV